MWGITELAVEVSFEITVSLKILIRMKPETVFIKGVGLS